MLVTRRWHRFPFAQFGGPLLAGLGYLIGAEAAFAIGTLSDNFFAPFWPPNSVLFTAFLFANYRHWWLYVAAVLPVHVVVEWQVAMPATQIVVAFATNCAIAMLNALAIKHLVVSPPWLNSFPRAMLFIIATACINPAIIALGGAFVRIPTEGMLDQFWDYWAQWYASNALGSLTLAPILMVLTEHGVAPLEMRSRQRVAEASLVVLALAAACIVAFSAWSWMPARGFFPAILYLPLPLVLWMTVRFGIKGASGAILVVTVTAISMALKDETIFAAMNSDMQVLALQLFLMGFAIPVLLLGASIEGSQRAEATNRDLAHKLLFSHDEEKRRTAKELHEGVCQELSAASLIAGQIAHLPPEDLRTNAKQVELQLQKSIHDLRSASYLLHPPLLDEAGLEPALSSFVDQYARRTDTPIDFTIPSDLGRLPSEIEITLFRFVQDALADFNRHSKGLPMRIGIDLCGPDIVITISEKRETRTSAFLTLLRRTMFVAPPGRQRVDLAAMRERLHRIGGTLEVDAVDQVVLKAIVRVGRTHTPNA